MKKTFQIFAICFITNSAIGQDISYYAALEACECLQTIKEEISEDAHVKCISNALAGYMTIATKEEKSFLGNSENLVATMLKINEVLSVICYENGAENYRNLEKKYYVDSPEEIANSYFFTTKLMMQEGKFDVAIEGLEIAVATDSNFVMAFDHLGVCYRNLQAYDKSIAAYKKSLQIFPLGKMALMNLGVVYVFQEDYENSNKYYQRLIRALPLDPEGYFGLGKNYLIEQEYELGLDNIYKAHVMYVQAQSDYQKDTEKLMTIVFAQLMQEGKDKLVKKLAKKYNIQIE